MKTITIFDAYKKAQTEAANFGHDPITGGPLISEAVRLRQANKFRAALLRRIERGDRARSTLAEIQAALLLVAPFEGRYNLIVDIVNQYFDERQS